MNLLKESLESYPTSIRNKINELLNENDLIIKKDNSTSKRINLNVADKDDKDRIVAFENFRKNLGNIEEINYTYEGGKNYTTPISIINIDGYEIILQFKPLTTQTDITTDYEMAIVESLDFYYNRGEWKESSIPSSYEYTIKNVVVAISNYFEDKKVKSIIVSRNNYSSKPNTTSIHALVNSAFKKFKNELSNRSTVFSWNPSDIYVCDERAYYNFIEDWNTALLDESSNSDTFNSILYNYLITRKVVGFSLKKLSGDAIPGLIPKGYNSADNTSYQHHLITPIYIPRLASNYGEDDVSFNTLTFDSYSKEEITWYYRNFGGSFTVEPKIAKEDSRLGKFPTHLWPDLYSQYNINTIQSNLQDLLPSIEEISNSELPVHYVGTDSNLTTIDWVNYINGINKTISVSQRLMNEWPHYINFVLLLTRAYKARNLNNLLDILYRGASKNTNKNAPYMLVSNTNLL